MKKNRNKRLVFFQWIQTELFPPDEVSLQSTYS